MVKLHERLDKVKLMSVKDPTKGTNIIGGKMSGIVNWNNIRYPQMYRSYQNIRSNFWIPQRISMMGDTTQWLTLPESTKNAFLRTIGQLATLDSKQTRMVLLFQWYLSEPTYAPIASNIAQQEATHNESYSYVLSSLVDKDTQDWAFDQALEDPTVIERNKRVDELYQQFFDNPTKQTFFEALVGCIILEGINFYSAFTFFFNLARNQLMLGTSTMIDYIQRDEVQHAYFFSQLLRYLMAEEPELNTKENVDFIYDSMMEAAELEIKWSKYNLADVEGIDLDELEGYIRNLCNRRLRGVGLNNIYEGVENSMPWMMAFDDTSLASTKTDLFENKSRTYKKVDETNDMDDL